MYNIIKLNQYSFLIHHHHHYQPINGPLQGQASLLIGEGIWSVHPPRCSNAGWRAQGDNVSFINDHYQMLMIVTGTDGLTCSPRHGGVTPPTSRLRAWNVLNISQKNEKAQNYSMTRPRDRTQDLVIEATQANHQTNEAVDVVYLLNIQRSVKIVFGLQIKRQS